MLRTLLLIICLLTAGHCFAGGDTIAAAKKTVAKHDTVKIAKKPAVLLLDTATVNLRKLDADALSKYKKQPEFQYNDVKLELSWWSRFWKWFWHWLDSLFSSNQKSVSGFFFFLKYFLIVAGVGALVFLILKLSGINVLHLFRKKPYSPIEYSELIENIHEINFEDEIDAATSAGNYRLAVRLLYLRCLKQLSDNGLINWQINKTNTNYVAELDGTPQHEGFKALTLQFEYVWYGDFIINGESFKRINTLFNNFKSSAR